MKSKIARNVLEMGQDVDGRAVGSRQIDRRTSITPF